MVKDLYLRPVTSVRISLTQKCNLKCFYCHFEGEKNCAPLEMTPDEIETITRVYRSFGIDKVKLTGGEPLLRPDIVEIVRRIKTASGISDISLTTNGTMLGRLAASLKEAGLRRVNVSLDTLDPETYTWITGSNSLEKVISGIIEARKAGLHPLKVNMVVLKKVNDHQISEMIDFTRDNKLILQLIEFETQVEDKIHNYYHADLAEIENLLKKEANRVTIRGLHHRSQYLLPDGANIEIVRPMHNTEFCRNCNRIRVTSDGRFKPCLFRSDNLVDFLTPLRQGASIHELKKLFLRALLRRKPFFS
jgi:cyclic pyranopterin phosphate synthase